MKPLEDFRMGFWSAFEGLRFLLSHRSLIRLALIPWCINLVLFIVTLFGLYHYTDDLLGLIITRPQTWYWLILYYLFFGLAFLILLIIATFFLCLIGNLIASPFHEWISEKTRDLVMGQGQEIPFSFSLLWPEAKRIVTTQFKKLLLILGCEVIALLLVLIPGIGAVLGALITILLLSFQFLDFPLGIERLSFSKQITVFKQHPMAWLGFGAALSFLLMIPIANISILPGGVVGASLLYYRKLR